MPVALPETLFRTNRGLCPCCGAPLRIDPGNALSTCGFCGQPAVLERRLRKAEPEVADAPLRLYPDVAPGDTDALSGRSRWARSWPAGHAGEAEATCPGCGDRLDYCDDAAVLVCPSCGTDCRLERRLRAPPPDPQAEVPRPRHPEERHHAGLSDDDHPDTEHLVYRIVHEPDADRRLGLAGKLGLAWGSWEHINSTLARLLPTLLAAVRDADPALQAAAADAVGKLLCQGDPGLRNAAVRAVERSLFEVGCPPAFACALGLGDGVCLKPLLDAAELAVRRDDPAFACWCLHGVSLLFQRNYGQHDVMGQIVLYRMLYLSGPVLAFALLLAQRQFGIGFYFKAETLLAFIDDAAVERPGLLAELEKSFYVGWPVSEAEFAGRLATYASLRTDAARTAALRHVLRLPEQATADQWDRLLALALPLWDADGALKSAAADLLGACVESGSAKPEAVHRLVAARGRSLPTEAQRAYLSAHPDTPHLSYTGLPYWESRPEPDLSPEMRRALDDWRGGIDRAVRANNAAQAETSARLRRARDLTVEVYDGVHDGPIPEWMEEESRSEAADPDDEPAGGEHEGGEGPAFVVEDASDEMVETYRQVVRQMIAMREQVSAYAPESVPAIEQQIEQIRAMFPGKQM